MRNCTCETFHVEHHDLLSSPPSAVPGTIDERNGVFAWELALVLHLMRTNSHSRSHLMFLRRRRFHLKLFHVEHRPGSFSFRGVRKHVPHGTVSIYARRLPQINPCRTFLFAQNISFCTYLCVAFKHESHYCEPISGFSKN